MQISESDQTGDQRQNGSSSRPLIVGHRGASHSAPENTMAAFELAWLEGADGVEADFRLTLDKRIVAMHDATSLRTTGVNLVVANSSLADLSLLDAGCRGGDKLSRQSIPTLDTILKALPSGKRLFIELKSGAEIIPPLLQLLAELQTPPEQIRILAFNSDLLKEIKRSNTRYRTCWLTAFEQSSPLSGGKNLLENIVTTLEESAADGLGGKAGSLVNEELVKTLRQRGKEIHVWTVDSVSAGRRFAALGVDTLITNRPGWLRAKLETGP